MKKESIAWLWIKFAAALNVRYPQVGHRHSGRNRESFVS